MTIKLLSNPTHTEKSITKILSSTKSRNEKPLQQTTTTAQEVPDLGQA